VPIRSPRGRSAAYRAIWQWPLRSPVRLAFVVVVVLAVAVGVTVGLGLLRGPEPAAAPLTPITGRPSASAVPSAGTPRTTPGSTSEPSPLPLSEAPQEALDAAERWVGAWVRPAEGTTPRQWLDGLRPLTTEAYMGVLAVVDPENIPATEVTGEPRAVRVADRNVQVEVETDAVTLRVLVVDSEAGWRIAGYDRV
jgi:hypothetical protein